MFKVRNHLLFCISMMMMAFNANSETIAIQLSQNPDTNLQAIYGQQITDSISNVTRKFKKFSLLERSQQGNITKELKFQNSSLVNDQTAVAIGQQSGAQLIAISSFVPASSQESMRTNNGSYMFYHMSLNVNIRFVDVKTGAVVFSKQIPAGADNSDQAQLLTNSLIDFERRFERELTTAFPNYGYVIKKISDTEYMIDIGTTSGVAVDDKYTIFNEGEDIVHPITKQVIKGDNVILADGEITSVSQQSATLKISQKSSTPIEIGLARVQAKAKSKGFFESLKDFSR